MNNFTNVQIFTNPFRFIEYIIHGIINRLILFYLIIDINKKKHIVIKIIVNVHLFDYIMHILQQTLLSLYIYLTITDIIRGNPEILL